MSAWRPRQGEALPMRERVRGVGWAKLARALYIVSPAVTMSADARNRLCGVYHTAFIRSSLEIRISVREVETLASFIHRFCVHPHRAFPCCALQRTAGFPKYEALRGFDWARLLTRAATPWRGPTDGVMWCVSDKCGGGSKDARAVRPYSAFVRGSTGAGARDTEKGHPHG
jgi:hypothetical protein